MMIANNRNKFVITPRYTFLIAVAKRLSRPGGHHCRNAVDKLSIDAVVNDIE